MEWCIRVQYDEVRGRHYWSEDNYSHRVWHLYYILAIRGTDAYMHFKTYMDDLEGEQGEDGLITSGIVKLAERIRASTNFTPENKPGVWFKIVDTKPQRLRREDWRWLLWRTGLRMKWQQETKNTPLTTTSPDSSPKASPTT